MGLCLGDLALHQENLDPPPESILNPSFASSRQLGRFFTSAELAHRRSAGPILLLQGNRDQIPDRMTDLLDGELCPLGDVVQHHRTYARANHDTILTQTYPVMAPWLRDRLRGRPGKQTCGR